MALVSWTRLILQDLFVIIFPLFFHFLIIFEFLISNFCIFHIWKWIFLQNYEVLIVLGFMWMTFYSDPKVQGI